VVASSFADRARPGIGGMDAVLFYLVAYGAMTVGAFAVVLFLSTPDRPVEAIDDLAGLGQSHPVCAASMAVFLISLIGIPLTAGFVGKLLLFVGAFDAPSDTPAMRHLYQILAAVAAVNAAVAAYYYLRVVGVMYLRSPIRPKADSRAWPTAAAAGARMPHPVPRCRSRAAHGAGPVRPGGRRAAVGAARVRRRVQRRPGVARRRPDRFAGPRPEGVAGHDDRRATRPRPRLDDPG